MASGMREPIQRTLVLTLGEAGTAVGQRLLHNLDEWGSPPVVTVQHLGAERESAEVIAAALREISRLSHRITLQRLGYGTARLGELVIWVVGASDEPLAQVARLANERANVSLGAEPLTLALVLGTREASVPNAREELTSIQSEGGDHRSDDETGSEGCGVEEVETREAPEDEASPERPCNSGHAAPCDSVPDERVSEPPLPPPISLDERVSGAFTGPCYVATPVNEAGLRLDNASALYEQAARFLVLHICTPLRDAPTWVEQSRGWQDRLGYASFGITWVVWPGAVARERARRRLAEALMPQLVGPPNASSDVDTLLRGAELAIPQLVPQLTPPTARAVVQSAIDGPPSPNLWTLFRLTDEEEHPLLAHLKVLAESREGKLDGCAPSWERLMQDHIEGVIAATRSWVAEALDREGFVCARVLIEALEQRLGDWAGGAEQRCLELREELPRIEDQARSVLERLTALLAEMPERRLRDLLHLLRRPSRWMQLWLRWRKIQHLHGRYCLLQAAALETQVTIEQMERACGVYWAAGSELQSISRELDRVELGLSDLFDLEGEATDWPIMPLLLGEDPDELLEDLMKRYVPSPQAVGAEFLAEFGPLSELWTGGSLERSSMDECLTRQVASLTEVSVWDVARCLHPQPDDLRAWIEELAAQAAPLWRWDPTTLSDGERAAVGTVTILLSTPNDISWDDDCLDLRMLPLPRADCLAVVALRWGIPGYHGRQA